MGTGYQQELDSKALGPFGPMFQTYSSAIEAFNRTYGIPSPLSVETEAQDFTQRFTGPVKAAARAQLACLGLANRRAQAYMQVPSRLALCRTPHDIINEQMAFWRTAAQQYSESYGKIFEAWTAPDAGLVSPPQAMQRDYISFNGAVAREPEAREVRQEQPAARQRRVA